MEWTSWISLEIFLNCQWSILTRNLFFWSTWKWSWSLTSWITLKIFFCSQISSGPYFLTRNLSFEAHATYVTAINVSIRPFFFKVAFLHMIPEACLSISVECIIFFMMSVASTLARPWIISIANIMAVRICLFWEQKVEINPLCEKILKLW